MSPNPNSNSTLKLASKNETSNHLTNNKTSSPSKEIIRDEIFTRFDKPFGFEQHKFNLWMMYIIPTAFTIYAISQYLTFKVPFSAYLLWSFPYGGLFGGLGITVGCHRYWTHKSFKANLPLQILLMCMQTAAMQYPIHKWCLDHRLHHKYTDTDCDPHNSKRGLYHTHIGWWIRPKTKEFEEKLKTFDMSDLENDPVVRFQSKYYWTLAIIFHFLIPIYVLRTIWGLPYLFCVAQTYLRYTISIHATSLVNSIAHEYGDKPYDKTFTSTDNILVSAFAVGEGWHNYHHTFPWDYKAAELGWKVNISTIFIDFCAAIGWAWDLKTVSPKMLEDRIRRTGDASRYSAYDIKKDITNGDHLHDKLYWGWDDETIPQDLRELTECH